MMLQIAHGRSPVTSKTALWLLCEFVPGYNQTCDPFDSSWSSKSAVFFCNQN